MYPPPPPQPPPPGYFPNNPWGDPPPKPPENPIALWRVVGLNFGIFMVYQTMLALVGDGFLIIDMVPLVLHWLVMLVFVIVSFSRGKKMAGFGWLISLIVLIIIGFGSCWWIDDLLGGTRF